MFDRACQRLLERFTETIDASLRVIATYDHERVVPFFIRDDLREVLTEADFNVLKIPLWNIHRANIAAGRLVATLGAARGSFHVYDNLLIYQIPVNRDGGIYVSIDRGVRFDRPTLTECREIIIEAEGAAGQTTTGIP